MTDAEHTAALSELSDDCQEAVRALPRPVAERLLTYHPSGDTAAEAYAEVRDAAVHLTARYAPPSPKEAQVTMTALWTLVSLLGPLSDRRDLGALLTLDGIARLRGLLLQAGTAAGTVNNRVSRLEQLRRLRDGLPTRRRGDRGAAPAGEGADGDTDTEDDSGRPYTAEEMAALRALAGEADSPLAAALARGGDVDAPTWAAARAQASRGGAPTLTRRRLQATRSLQVLSQPMALADLLTGHPLTRRDLDAALENLPMPDEATRLALLRG